MSCLCFSALLITSHTKIIEVFYLILIKGGLIQFCANITPYQLCDMSCLCISTLTTASQNKIIKSFYLILFKGGSYPILSQYYAKSIQWYELPLFLSFGLYFVQQDTTITFPLYAMKFLKQDEDIISVSLYISSTLLNFFYLNIWYKAKFF